MKNLAFLSTLLVLATSPAFSQSNVNTAATTDGIHSVKPDLSYTHIFVQAGMRPVKTSLSTIQLSYQDESPTTDFFSSEKLVEASEGDVGVDVGLEFGQLNRHHLEIAIGGSLGKAERFYGMFGFGWNFPVWQHRILFRPVAALTWGRSGFDLGDMENTSVYIQVNDQLFYDDFVDVDISSNQLSALPRFDVEIKVFKQVWLRGNVGYHYTLFHTDPSIRFHGHDEEGSIVNAKESIKESNILLRINEAEIKRLPIDLDGIFWNVGLSWVMGK